MTDEKYSAGEGRELADDGPPARGRWTSVVAHRWPTALGLAVAALAAFDLEVDAGFVSSFSAIVVLMALVYVGAAALWRSATWVVFLAALAVVIFFPATSGGGPVAVLLAAAAVFLALGVVRGRLREPGGLAFQTAGVLAFGAAALAALYVAPEIGAYLVALALFCHAAWDVYHYLRDRVVVRSYAEFCGVLDLALGAAILVLA